MVEGKYDKREEVKTKVDDFLTYLEGKDKVSLTEVASHLNIPLTTLQSWVDFLVEENIVGIEYKFTKPFVYLSKKIPLEEIKKVEEEEKDFESIKRRYFENAQKKSIPLTKIEMLWKNHVLDVLSRKKKFFETEVNKRAILNHKEINALWERYVRTVKDRW